MKLAICRAVASEKRSSPGSCSYTSVFTVNQAALAYAARHVNTRAASKPSFECVHPQIILTSFLDTAVMALVPSIFSTPVLRW